MKTDISGDLGAKRDSQRAKAFGKGIKRAGDVLHSAKVLSQKNRVRVMGDTPGLAVRTGAISTVNGTYDKSAYQGVKKKAGR